MDRISVVVVSPPMGTSSETVNYSFVFDEVYRLARKGLDVHVTREFQDETSFCYGIYFHGLGKLIDVRAVGSTLENTHVPTNFPP